MAVAPMNGHFVWSDGANLQETHINDILNNIDQIPSGIATGFLILVLRYVDPVTLEEYDNPKLGHYISSQDNYYLDIRNGIVEFAQWNDDGQTETIVYELRGPNKEKTRIEKIANLPENRKFQGVLMPDDIWERERVRTFREW